MNRSARWWALALIVLPAAASGLEVKGEVSFVERLMLPPSATLTVELVDAGRAGAPVLVVDSQRVEGADGAATVTWPVIKLVDRVWVRSDPADRPGVLRIFLHDGTLLSGSCWETYRLSPWKAGIHGTLSWTEDAAEIHAVVVSLTEDELVLRLDLADGPVDHRFAPAAVPFVCPDLPR